MVPVVTKREPDCGPGGTRGPSRRVILSYARASSMKIGGTGDRATKDESRRDQLDFTILNC